MSVTESGPIQRETDSLDSAIESVHRLRSALAAVIEGIPDFRFSRPNEMSSDLGIDPKLAWNLARCVDEKDPFAAAQFLPGPTGVKRFLNVASRRNAPVALIEAARNASMRFNDMVRFQAGTRKNFNILMTGNTAAIRPSAIVEHRRRAFEGNSYVFGVHARTVFRSNIIMPSADPMRWDLATLRGFVDFRRLRRNVAWRIKPAVSVDASRTVHHDVEREAIDPAANHHDMVLPLMLSHCTKPIPAFRPVRGADGGIEYEFVSESVGADSSITCVTGEVLRRVEPRYRNNVYDDLCMTFPIRTPAMTLLFDMVIHREFFGTEGDLRPELYNDLFAGGPGFYYENPDRLPLHEKIAYLGRGPDVALATEIPHYTDMLKTAMQRCGCDAADYDIYRIQMDYPPIATQLMMRRALPPAPDDIPRVA